MKQKREKKPKKLLYLSNNKLDCTEMVISQSISDLNVSHEELKAIMDEKNDYDDKKQQAADKKLIGTLQV